MSSKSWKLWLVTAFAVVSCGRLQSEADDASDAVDTVESTSNESALMDLASVENMTSCSISSEDVAKLALAGFKAKVKDSSCVTATQNGNAVDYVMNSCTGRWGRVTVTGTLHVVYTVNSDCSVDAVATGKAVKVNKATVDIDSSAHYAKNSQGVETLTVKTKSKGSGERGSFDHSGDYLVTRDSSAAAVCRTLDGTWSTVWNGARGTATTGTVVSGVKKCGDSCPAAGGRIEYDGFAGRKLIVTFDGSAVAKWETKAGRTGTVNLNCTP